MNMADLHQMLDRGLLDYVFGVAGIRKKAVVYCISIQRAIAFHSAEHRYHQAVHGVSQSM
jgi:hypothetical protein